MAEPILLLKTKVQIESARGTAIVITGVTKAAEAVFANSGTNGLAAGDLVVLKDISGMAEMNGRVIRVKASGLTSTSFTAEGLDSTGFSAYVSGGSAFKITALLAFDNLTSFNFPEPQPTRIDVTTIHGSTKTEVFGLDEAPQITMSANSDPLAPYTIEMRKASRTKTSRVFRVELNNGNVMIMHAFVAGGRGIDGAAGDVATGQTNLTLVQEEQFFAA